MPQGGAAAPQAAAAQAAPQAAAAAQAAPPPAPSHERGVAKPIEQLDRPGGKVVKRWKSASDAARQLGRDQSTISKACRGKLAPGQAGAGLFRFAVVL